MKQIYFTTLLLFFLGTMNNSYAQQLPAFSRSDYYQGYQISDFTLGDFNSDGIVDIAAIKYENIASILISLGKGDGNFEEYNTLECEINNFPHAIVSDDFNCDGNLDLLINTTIFLGNGEGGFERKTLNQVISGYNPISGDCNNDNIPDIVVGGNTTLNTFLGNSDGTFAEPLSYSILPKTGPAPVSAGDFNHDGNLDIILTYECYIDEYGGTCKSCKRTRIGMGEQWVYAVLLLGNGDGTFDENYIDISGQPGGITVSQGDFNRDGNMDVLCQTYRFEMYLGDSEGALHSTWFYERFSRWASREGTFLIDADQDGLSDIISIGKNTPYGDYSETYSFMKGNGDGTFGEEIVGTIYGNSIEGIYKIIVDDINRDNQEDFIALIWGNKISIYLNEGTTGVENDNENNPLSYRLLQNYPNPFNQSTTIPFVLEKRSFVEIVIYDLMGQKVSTLINEKCNPGLHYVIWNGMNNENQRVGSGIYLYCLKANRSSMINKLIFMP